MPTVIDELVTVLGLDIQSGVGQKISTFNAHIDSVTRAVGKAALGLTAAAASIAYFVERMNKQPAELYKLGQVTGISTDALQAWKFAAEQAGGSASSMEADMVGLIRSMSSPIPGEFNQGLFMLGINVRKAGGELKTVEEVLLDISDRIQGMSPQLQYQWMERIGLGPDTLLLLQKGRAEVGRYRKEAMGIPLVLKGEQLKNAQKFTIQMNTLRLIMSYLGQEVSSAAGPAMEKLVVRFNEWLKASRAWIQLNLRAVIDGIVNGFERFGGLLDRMSGAIKDHIPWLEKFTKRLRDADVVGGLVFAALTALVVVVAVLGAKFFLVAGAIAAAGLAFEDFYTWLEGGDSYFGDLVDWVEKLWLKFSTRFPNLTQLVRDFWGVLKGFPAGVMDKFERLAVVLKDVGGWLVTIIDKLLLALDKAVGEVRGAEGVGKPGRGLDGKPGAPGLGGLDGKPGDLTLSQILFGNMFTGASKDGEDSDSGWFEKIMKLVWNPKDAPMASGLSVQPDSRAFQITHNSVNITNHIQGQNALGIATEVGRREHAVLQGVFPGLVPAAQ